MRLTLAFVICVAIGFSFASCGGSSGSPTFCDTTCMKDTMKFSKEDHVLKPYVYISAKNCMPDTVIWSYSGMDVNRKMSFSELTGQSFHISRDFVRCVIKDTSYAWLLFNDCSNGQGYSLKLPFDKKRNLGRKASAINASDKKFYIADGLAVYTDRGNLFVEDMFTEKQAMMTFGKDIKPDYSNIHTSIDSVNITPARIWAKVKIDGEWKELEKKIELK